MFLRFRDSRPHIGRARPFWLLGLGLAMVPLAPALGTNLTPATCAWPLKTTVDTLNVAFPDASATYWTTPLLLKQDLKEVLVTGQYTDARYISINAYNNSGSSYSCQGVDSGLADFRIAPDAGAANPFQVAAQPGGGFEVSLARSQGDASAGNFVPLPSSGCQPAPVAGKVPANLTFVVFRVYLPTGSEDAVTLPTLSLRYRDGSSSDLTPCDEPTSDTGALPSPVLRRAIVDAAPCGRPGVQACPPELTFFRANDSATGGLFPNTDNKYIAALVKPKARKLVVVRARGASFPPGTTPGPWPSAANLRYWSMCSNIYRRPWPVVTVQDQGQEIVGCAADLDTGLSGRGTYTYVVSRLRDRPAPDVLARSGATWLPFSDSQPFARHLLILRNMLGDDFSRSVQNCAEGSDPTSIEKCEETMRAYYPDVAECRVGTFVDGGTAACFAEYRRQNSG